MLTSHLSHRLSGTLSIDILSLSWKGPQTIQGLQFESIDGKVKFSCEEISSSAALASIALPAHKIGNMRVYNPQLVIRQTLIEKPLSNQPKVQVASLLGEIPIHTSIMPLYNLPFAGSLTVEKGKLTVLSEKIDPVIASLTQMQLKVDETLRNIDVHVEGSTLQGSSEGSFSLNSKFTNTHSLDRNIQSHLILQSFPVDKADKLLSLQMPMYRELLSDALGKTLDLDSSISFADKEAKAVLRASSEKLSAQAELDMQEDAFALSQPGTLSLTLSPSLTQKIHDRFPDLTPFTSKDPIFLELTVTALSFPKSRGLIDPYSMSFKSELEIKPYQTSKALFGCSGTIESQRIHEKITGNFNISIDKDVLSSKSKLDFSIRDPFVASLRESTASIELAKTPVTFLASFSRSSIPFAQMFGDTVSGRLFLESTASGLDITSKLSSSLMQIKQGSFAWKNGELSLKKPLGLSYLMTPQNFSYFAKNEEIKLQTEAQLTAEFSKLDIKDFTNFENIQTKMRLSSSPLSFTEFFTLKNQKIEDLTLDLSLNSLSKISMDLKSKKYSLKFKGGLGSNQALLFWDHPIQITYLLTNEDLKSFYLREHHPNLLVKAPLQVEIEPARIPLKPFSYDELDLQGRIFGDNLLFENASDTEKVAIDELSASLHFIGTKDALEFSSKASIAKGSLDIKGELSKLRAPGTALNTNIALKEFPVELLDSFLNYPLAPVLGSLINLNFALNKHNDIQTIAIDAKSPFLTLSGAISLTPEGIRLADPKNPAEFDFLLTKPAYDVLNRSEDKMFSLTEEALFKASIAQLDIPFIEGRYFRPDLSRLLLNMTASSSHLIFENENTGNPFHLINTKLSAQKKDKSAPLSISLTSNTSGTQEGSLHMEAQIKRLFDQQGTFNPSLVQSDWIAHFHKFPTDVLEMASPGDQPLMSNFLGPFFDMSLQGSLHDGTGPLSMKLHSQNVQFSFEGQLTSGILTLKENLMMQVALNNKTSQVLKQKHSDHPLLSLSADHPLTVEISAQGFSVPVFPLQISDMNIAQARINPGKVYCENTGNVNLMLGILKSKKASQSDKLELWFAPIDLSVNRGLMNIERTEVLVASTYDIALWGKINFPGDRVNMILGLTAQCLEAAFSIKGLPNDYVLQIPVTGTLKKVTVDKGSATSQIVALTLWQSKHLADSASSGIPIIGGLINQVLAPPGSSKSAPKPKKPFPWQQQGS